MGKVRWVAIAALGLAFGAGPLAACGGSTGPELSSAGDAGNSEASAEAGEKPYTLDDVCDRTGPIVCELRKPCCETGPGFDLAACLADAKKDCEADVTAVRAGTATFHGERIPDCISKYRAILSNCTLTFDLLQKYASEIAQCTTFEGQLPEGATCERTSQCKPGASANEVAGCDDDTKKCRITKLLVEGDSCTIGEGFTQICKEGLYCDVSFAAQPFTGVCKKKTSLGVSCDKDKKPFALECGLGNYCEATTGVCTAGKPGNAACANDLECASVSCTKPDAGALGTCKPPASLVKPDECKGG